MTKILVSDPLSDEGLDILNKSGFPVDVKPGLTEDELCGIIGDYDCLIIRSGTKVTSKVIDAATNLRVIGRAGVGVDNVDIPYATDKGNQPLPRNCRTWRSSTCATEPSLAIRVISKSTPKMAVSRPSLCPRKQSGSASANQSNTVSRGVASNALERKPFSSKYPPRSLKAAPRGDVVPNAKDSLAKFVNKL